MSIGLKKEQIVKILEEQGIVKGEPISAEVVRNAIATVIEENNKLLEK